ncbi:MAG: UDP-N-acetylmuramoyl-tripeptide--D-alanyl-D-alanine ligase [bacterium]
MVTLSKSVFRFARWKVAQIWLRIWPDIDIIGIAGSVGKTTTKEVIAGVLKQRFKTVRTDANWDPIFNLPITSFKASGSCKFIAELGIDGIGQMDRYLTLVQPRVGVLTRLTLEHTDDQHFGSLERAVKEEVKMLKSLPSYGWAVLNGDDERIRKFAKETEAHKMFYGFGVNNNLRIMAFKQEITGSKVKSTFEIKLDTGQIVKVTTNLLGRQNALCICAGILVGIIMGMDFEDIQKGISTVFPISGRLEPKIGKGRLIIDDSYNASPSAVEAAIDVLVDLDPNNGILVLGDMLELGKYGRKEHYTVGRYAKSKGVRTLIAYGEFATDVIEGYGKGTNTFVANTHEEIVKWVNTIKKGIALVKGSHGMHMEKVVEALTTG